MPLETSGIISLGDIEDEFQSQKAISFERLLWWTTSPFRVGQSVSIGNVGESARFEYTKFFLSQEFRLS